MLQITDKTLEHIAQELAPEDLPGDLADVADIIGVKSALRLARELPGRMYITQWSDDESKWNDNIRDIVDVIGKAQAEAVVRNFEHQEVVVPLCTALWRQWVHNIIAASSDTENELCRRFKISDRTVRRIRAKARNNKNQLGLF